MPTEVRITVATISHIYFGAIGMKKNATEVTTQMTAVQMKAFLFEPTSLVNQGESPPNIMQVTSPKAIRTV